MRASLPSAVVWGRFGAKGSVSDRQVEGSAGFCRDHRHWSIEYFIKSSTYHSFPTQTPRIVFKKCRGKLRQVTGTVGHHDHLL
jgi:hypothetical protein